MDIPTLLFVLSVIIILGIFLSAKYNAKRARELAGRNKGKAGEEAVAAVLDGYARRKGIYTLHGAKLPLYDDYCEIDHMIFGTFGVVVVETKAVSGVIVGRSGDREVRHMIGARVHSMYNPILQNKTHCDNVRHHMKKAGFSEFPVWSFVVFSAPDVDITGFNAPGVMRLSELERALDSLPERPCDYRFAYRYISEIKK